MSGRYILDADLSILKELDICVVGYGNQGRPQSIVLRDNDLNVIVGNIRDEAWERASRDGFEVYEIGEACRRSDLILLLIPDEVAPKVFRDEVAPNVRGREHVIIDFASGYNIFYGFIRPLENMDVILVAPRMIGDGILRLHREGRGYPVLIGVDRDVSGRAWEYAAALARGIGAIGRPGGIGLRSSFREEVLIDLMSEHTWMPLLIASFLAYFDVLVDEFNVSPEAVILELYASGELGETGRAMAELGLFEQLRLHSRTSQYGQLTRIFRFYGERLKKIFRREAMEIIDGSFARDWMLEQELGLPRFSRLLDMVKGSRMAKHEDELYRAMGRR